MGASGRWNCTVRIIEQLVPLTRACPRSTSFPLGSNVLHFPEFQWTSCRHRWREDIFLVFHVKNFRYKENQAKKQLKIRTHLEFLYSVLATCVWEMFPLQMSIVKIGVAWYWFSRLSSFERKLVIHFSNFKHYILLCASKMYNIGCISNI